MIRHDPPAIIAQVSPDAERLQALEVIFEQCRVAWVKGTAALAEILEGKLWKSAGYKSENDYLQRRWGVNQSQAYRKVAMGKLAREIDAGLPEGLPEGVRESHLAALAGYPPDLRQEILLEAQRTCDGRLTARHIEMTARRLADERREAAARRLDTGRLELSIDDTDEDDEDGEEEEAPAPRSAPASTIRRAAADPVVSGEELARLESKARRLCRKLGRVAAALNLTAAEVLRRYGG